MPGWLARLFANPDREPEPDLDLEPEPVPEPVDGDPAAGEVEAELSAERLDQALARLRSEVPEPEEAEVDPEQAEPDPGD